MNPLLEKIKTDVTAKVIPENKDEFERVTAAAKKIMFDKKTHANMELVRNPASRKNPVETVSKGVAGLMWLMYQQSKQTMKPHVMVFVGIIVMCEAFDFAERGLGLQLTNDMVARTAEQLAVELFKKLGIDQQTLQNHIIKGKQEIDDYKSGKITPDQIKAKMQEQSDSGLPPPKATGAVQ